MTRLYAGYVSDTKTQFKERTAEVKETVKKAREDLEAALPGMQLREDLTDEEMLEGLEYELGHKLQYGWEDGQIRLSELEAIEFSAVEGIYLCSEEPLCSLRRNTIQRGFGWILQSFLQG